TATVVEQTGAATDRDAAWATATADLSAFAGQTVRVIVEAADADTPSLVEAAVDDITITRQGTPVLPLSPAAERVATPAPLGSESLPPLP
ncbi:MAG TPA: hypothetical protein VKZ82_11295, partial [Nonomuraea sp.]|nr:hypothetical protein [Nonomuraea sp.]